MDVLEIDNELIEKNLANIKVVDTDFYKWLKKNHKKDNNDIVTHAIRAYLHDHGLTTCSSYLFGVLKVIGTQFWYLKLSKNKKDD